MTLIRVTPVLPEGIQTSTRIAVVKARKAQPLAGMEIFFAAVDVTIAGVDRVADARVAGGITEAFT